MSHVRSTFSLRPGRGAALIAIDYPQRDAHLHSAHPLQVQVVPPAGGRPGEVGTPGKAKVGGTPFDMP